MQIMSIHDEEWHRDRRNASILLDYESFVASRDPAATLPLQRQHPPLLMRPRLHESRQNQDATLMTRENRDAALFTHRDDAASFMIRQNSSLPSRLNQQAPGLTSHNKNAPFLTRQNQAASISSRQIRDGTLTANQNHDASSFIRQKEAATFMPRPNQNATLLTRQNHDPPRQNHDPPRQNSSSLRTVRRLAPRCEPEVIEVKDEHSDNEYIDVVNYFESDASVAFKEKFLDAADVSHQEMFLRRRQEKHDIGHNVDASDDSFRGRNNDVHTEKLYLNEFDVSRDKFYGHVIDASAENNHRHVISYSENFYGSLRDSAEKTDKLSYDFADKFNGQFNDCTDKILDSPSNGNVVDLSMEKFNDVLAEKLHSRDVREISPEQFSRRDGDIFHRRDATPIDLTSTPSNEPNQKEEIKVLRPEDINKDFENQKNDNQKYTLLKKQLSSEPLAKQIVISRNLNNQIEKQSLLNRQRLLQAEPEVLDESILLSECCRFDQNQHPFVINVELSGRHDAILRYSVDDLILRYRVLVFLWILLGERRLLKVGYPTDAVHLVLWRVVHICCSISGVKSAAAVPLPSSHDCGTDMLCFRDHVHRFLEVCAPTRDHWKQFGWASLTVDAVLAKIYKQELIPTLVHRSFSIPVPIRMAMCKLANLEKVNSPPPPAPAQPPVRTLPRWRRVPRPVTPVANRSYLTSHFRPILPKPVVVPWKKKRGRPVKLNRTPVDTAGRIERVMLWRFVLNLLEEPGNAACIHWLNRDEGIFRILNTDWLARIWGRRHGNPRMTYEKMARAMRTYYRSKVLQPVPRNRNLPRKLVYRFNPALIKRVTNK